MTNREKNVALAKKLATMRTNGDAWAFAVQSESDAMVTAESLGKYGDFASIELQGMVNNAIQDVSRNLDPLRGQDSEPLSTASFKELRGAIGRLYALIWAIEQEHPEAVRLTPWEQWAQLAVDIPESLVEGGKVVIEGTGDAAAGLVDKGADAVRKVLWEFIKGTWPILLAGAVVLGGGIYLAATGKIPVGGVKVGPT